MDVTERRQAEERLQLQLQFSEQLLELSPQPVSMFDARGRYVTVNRAWEEFTGRSRQEVIGREVGFFMPRMNVRCTRPRTASCASRAGA